MPPLPPPNEPCFLDANIFYYDVIASGDLSVYCEQIIEEILAGRRQAFTTAIAVAEAVHKIKFSEISTTFNRPRSGLLSWVKSHPESIRAVSGFRAALEKIISSPVTIVPVDNRLVAEGAEVAATTGLLINDAITLAVMNARSIRHVVTNDDDFDSVSGIHVWKPR